MINYKVVDYPLQNRSYSDLIINCRNSEEETEINFLSKNDYKLVDSIEVKEETFISSINKGEIILYHFNKSGYYKVDIEARDKLFVQKDFVPEYTWESGVVLYLDRVNRFYKCIVNVDKEVFSFEPKYPISNHWFEHGILFYQNDGKENNWIKCIDPNNGDDLWKIEFPWQFVRLELYQGLIILDYHAYENIRTDAGYKGERDWSNPSRYTIAIDGETGDELWRLPFTYSKLDHDRGVILSGSDNNLLEVQVSTGEIKSDIETSLSTYLGYNPHFADDDGIYYLTHDHSFGKVRKADGTILWEFDLLDKKGKKRRLSDWLLLGNGSLVLQASPNHLNGDLTCVFDPKENLHYSRIRNGVRIGTDYA